MKKVTFIEDNYVSQFTTEEVEAIEELVAKENVE